MLSQAAGFKPGVVAYTSLIKGHCADGELGLAAAVLDEMAGAEPPVMPNVRTVNTFLRGCILVRACAPRASAHTATRVEPWPWGVVCRSFLSLSREPLATCHSGTRYVTRHVLQCDGDARRRSVLGSWVGVWRLFPPFFIPNRIPRGFTQDASTDGLPWGSSRPRRAARRARGRRCCSARAQVSTVILGRRMAPFPPFRIPHRVPHGFPYSQY